MAKRYLNKLNRRGKRELARRQRKVERKNRSRKVANAFSYSDLPRSIRESLRGARRYARRIGRKCGIAFADLYLRSDRRLKRFGRYISTQVELSYRRRDHYDACARYWLRAGAPRYWSGVHIRPEQRDAVMRQITLDARSPITGWGRRPVPPRAWDAQPFVTHVANRFNPLARQPARDGLDYVHQMREYYEDSSRTEFALRVGFTAIKAAFVITKGVVSGVKPHIAEAAGRLLGTHRTALRLRSLTRRVCGVNPTTWLTRWRGGNSIRRARGVVRKILRGLKNKATTTDSAETRLRCQFNMKIIPARMATCRKAY